MPMIWRSFLPALTIMLLSVSVVSASGPARADSLFNDAMMEEALAEYERAFEETSDPDLRWKAFYRSCEILGMLHRYGEAADKLISTPVPRGAPHEAYVLLIKADMLRQVLSVYDYVRSGEAIDGQEKKDVFHLTAEEIESLINDVYADLWGRREELISMKMSDAGYFLSVDGPGLAKFPALFDYLVLSWSDYLLDVPAMKALAEKDRPPAVPVLAENFDEPVDTDAHPAMLAAALMEEAYRFRTEGRLEAAERWRIRRLLLPIRNWHRFDPVGLAETGDGRNLYMRDARNRAFAVLIDWMDTLKTDEARAWAGTQAAIQLKEGGWPYGPPEAPGRIVEIFARVEEDFPETEAARHAESLRLEIEKPRLRLNRGPSVHRPAGALKVTAYNLEKVHVSVYRVDPEMLMDEFIQGEGRESRRGYCLGRGMTSGFGVDWYRSDRGKDLLKSWLRDWTAQKAFTVGIGDKGKYTETTKSLDLGELPKGVYLVAVCENESYEMGVSLMSVAFVNITDFMLLGSAGLGTKTVDAWHRLVDEEGPREVSDEGFHFYTLDAETGKPVAGADIKAYVYDSVHDKHKKRVLRTSGEGTVSLSLPVDVRPQAQSVPCGPPGGVRGGVLLLERMLRVEVFRAESADGLHRNR